MGSGDKTFGGSGDKVKPCQLKTGSYVGDGSTSLAVTGVGFKPKLVMIWAHKTSAAYTDQITKMTEMHGELSYDHFFEDKGTDNPHGLAGDKIISLDDDGFTVDDDGADRDPNSNGVTYDYIAFG